MGAFFDFICSLTLATFCAVLLYWAWKWARENFNIGHIQLQEFQRRQYHEVPDTDAGAPYSETAASPLAPAASA